MRKIRKLMGDSSTVKGMQSFNLIANDMLQIAQDSLDEIPPREKIMRGIERETLDAKYQQLKDDYNSGKVSEIPVEGFYELPDVERATDMEGFEDF